MHKRAIIIFLCAVLALCFTGAAVAAEEPALKTREDAMERAKELFPEIIEGKESEMNVSYRENSIGGRNLWHLTWRGEVNREGPTPRINLRLGEKDGKLYNFNNDLAEGIPEEAKVLSRSEARKAAKRFARAHHPEKMEKLEFDPDYGPSSSREELELEYLFRWHQVVNDIPFPGNSISIRVNALTGEVKYFNCNWRGEEDLPENAEVIRDELIDKIENKLGVYPSYIHDPASSPGISKAVPVYRINTSARIFDATSGKPLDHEGNEMDWEDAVLYEEDFELQPAPEKPGEVGESEKQNNSKKAMEKARSVFNELGFEGEITRSGSSRSSGPGYTKELWRYGLEREGEPRNNINISINARTGEIERYTNGEAEESGGEGEVSRQEALRQAEQFLEKIGIDMNEIAWDQENETLRRGAYHFEWTRLVNGIPFRNNDINVSVNSKNGKVTSFNRHDRPARSFASTKDLLTEEEALEVLKKEKPLKLSYFPLRGSEGKYVLGYRIDYGSGIDARTGELLKDTGGDGESLQSYREKLEGHWARSALTLLADSGLLPAPQEFDPNEEVTRAEGLKVLGAASDTYYSRYNTTESPFKDVPGDYENLEAILRAVDNDIIEPGGELNPGAPLTREDLAVWLVNGMGYKETAELPVSMELDFEDAPGISSSKQNHVAIASALNIIGGESKNFRPQEPVTWGELASVVVKAAPQMRN